MSYKPLEGVKIVELSTMVAASSCGRMLADWGADIIKVENGAGDMFRYWPRTFNIACSEDENPIFDTLNANKQGVVLNLKTEQGMEIIHKLLSDADVFLTNTRPKALARLGLDYESLKERYPGLICATITGFGDKGPRANDPGFDTVAFWASSGFNADMMVEGEGAYPVYAAAGPGDIITAMGLMSAITAALYKRKETGLGDHVYTSLYGTALWCFNIMAVASEERYGYKYPKKRSESAPTASPFRTKDNEWVMTTLIKLDEQWPTLCKVLGADDLAHDPKYCTSEAQKDPEARAYLIKRFDEIYATKTADEWKKALTEADLVNDKLGHYSDMEKSEQAWANEFIHKVTCPSGHETVLVRPSMRSERMGIPEFHRGPLLGEHTEQVLLGMGYTAEEIAQMKQDKAIGCNPRSGAV